MSFLTLFWGALPLVCSGQGAPIYNPPKAGIASVGHYAYFFFKHEN